MYVAGTIRSELVSRQRSAPCAGSTGWTQLSPEERARFQAMKETWVEPAGGARGGGPHKKGEVRIHSGYAANGARLTDIVARDHQVSIFMTVAFWPKCTHS